MTTSADSEFGCVFSNTLITDKKTPFMNDCTQELEIFGRNIQRAVLPECKERPFVLFLDAPFGCGKTTFIDMFGQQLQNDGDLVIKYNAWQYDYTNEPLFTFVMELVKQLEAQGVDIKDLEGKYKNILKWALPVGKLVGNVIVDFCNMKAPLTEFIRDAQSIISDSISHQINQKMDDMHETKQLIHQCKNLLTNIACKHNDGNKMIYCFIDELDRCKPTYAIEVLEIIKHLFSCTRVCFIVSVNMDGIARSCRQVYGGELGDAKDYLKRFYDICITLPEIQLASFLRQLMTQMSMPTEFNNQVIKNTILSSAVRHTFTLRDFSKYLQDVKYFLRLNKNRIPECFLPAIACMLAQRRANPKSYLSRAGGDGRQIITPMEEIKPEYLLGYGADLTDFEEKTRLKWGMNLLEGSKDKNKLAGVVTHLHRELSLYRQTPRHPQYGNKNNGFISIKLYQEMVVGVYGSPEPEKIKDEIFQVPRTYINHFEIFAKIAGFMDHIADSSFVGS